MPVRNIQILILVTFVCIACYIQAEQLKYAGKLGTAIQLIRDNYVEDVEPDELYTAAMQGLVSRLDRFSEYIPPAQYEEFQSLIEQQFGGVGILIEGPPAVKQLTVVTPIPGTPAFKAGMLPGDVITAIGDKSTEGLLATDATALMRGPVGEAVQLQVKRMGVPELLDLSIVRADIQVDSVYGDRIRADSSWDYFLEEDSRIAYIRITLFGERTVEEFSSALTQVRDKARALIIDLRANPGGILPASVDLCNLLVEEGTIVSTKGRREGYASEFKANSAVALDPRIPIVVLVDDQSASASEIMAGCLQDLGRAKVGGQRSYGKGTVQQVFPLDNDQTALKFTTARFYRPSGKNIHRGDGMTEDEEWGVSPDPQLKVPMSDIEQLYLNLRWRRRGDPRIVAAGERPPAPRFAADPQLARAVQYLQETLKAKR